MTQALQVVTVTVTGDRDGDIDLNLNWASQETQIIITNSNRMSTLYIIILKTYFSVAKTTLQLPTPPLPPYFYLSSDYATFKLVFMRGKILPLFYLLFNSFIQHLFDDFLP